MLGAGLTAPPSARPGTILAEAVEQVNAKAGAGLASREKHHPDDANQVPAATLPANWRNSSRTTGLVV